MLGFVCMSVTAWLGITDIAQSAFRYTFVITVQMQFGFSALFILFLFLVQSKFK